MGDIIDKIQHLVYQAADFSEEEKKGIIVRLEGFRGIKDEKMKKIFEKLLIQTEEKPEAVKDFFGGFDKVLKAYLEKGAPGLIGVLDEELAK